jgi:hypothetical protein
MVDIVDFKAVQESRMQKYHDQQEDPKLPKVVFYIAGRRITTHANIPKGMRINTHTHPTQLCPVVGKVIAFQVVKCGQSMKRCVTEMAAKYGTTEKFVRALIADNNLYKLRRDIIAHYDCRTIKE